MVNRPRNLGTLAETAVATYLTFHGWKYAERRSLKGTMDKGDITGIPGLCIEVKYGNSGLKLGPWLTETGIERINAGADYGVLVVKPKGLGVRRVEAWFAVMLAGEFSRLKALAVAEDMTRFYTHGTTPLSVVDGPLEEYTAATVGISLGQGGRRLLESEILALTLRPPGTKDKPDSWYRVTTFAHMVRLLHAAGYGDGPPYD